MKNKEEFKKIAEVYGGKIIMTEEICPDVNLILLDCTKSNHPDVYEPYAVHLSMPFYCDLGEYIAKHACSYYENEKEARKWFDYYKDYLSEFLSNLKELDIAMSKWNQVAKTFGIEMPLPFPLPMPDENLKSN